jgi:hypothetical protein
MAAPDAPQPRTLTDAVIPVASLILLVALSFYHIRMLRGPGPAAGPAGESAPARNP